MNTKTTIEELPAEVLSLIFFFLCDDEGTNLSDSNNTLCTVDIIRSSTVCKRWRDVIFGDSPRLWRKMSWRMIPMSSKFRKTPVQLESVLNLPYFLENLKEIDLVRPGRGILYLLLIESKDLRHLLQFTPRLTSLQVKISIISNKTLQSLCTLCPNLEHIVLISENSTFDSTGFQAISNNLKGIKTLSLESQHMNMGIKCTDILDFIDKHCSTLMDFNVQSFLHMDLQVLKEIAEKCNKLTHLKLGKINAFPLDSLESLFKNAKNLSELVVECWFWSEEHTEIVTKYANNLESLKISINRGEAKQTVFTMLESLKKPLKVLHFICDEFSTDWVFENASFWRNIEDLDLSKSQIDNEGLKLIASQCNNINYLYLNGCSKFSEEGLDAITKANPRITKLGLCRSRVDDEITQVVAKNCKRLQFFMTNTKGIHYSMTNVGLLSLVSNCPDLLRMDLTAQHRLDDESMGYIVEYCPKLQFLKLTNCISITDQGIKTLATGCPDLHVLDIANLINVTDDSMEAIASGVFANRLWLLNANSTGISDAGIVSLDKGCPAINRITAQQVRGVTDQVYDLVNVKICKI
eukprot:TRINITY_DN10253_c0_g1_i1.p1 TRINITY_DN10253_c0_g1~~TRINITY_DN10253_c0_g1_i1.p1  ORF type:complete len:579 (-),score=124.34 TRINITY_DN10253_c0_g1_i1:107-1843(-)